MTSFNRQMIILIFSSMLSVSLFACNQPKEGKVIISNQQFSMRKADKHNWVIDAKGTVKNVGESGVKNVVVTGDCESCENVIFGVTNTWSISNVDKTPEQKDSIADLPVGAEKEFKFTDVAFMMRTDDKTPEKMPDKIKCKILSFETVQ